MKDLEREIQEKGLTAPRVSLANLEANIADTEILKHVTKSGQVLRFAILTTDCGYAVVGRPSVSVSSENDNAEIGEKVAIDNSKNELWPLMGYALKQYLYDQAQDNPPVSTWQERVEREQSELGYRLEKLDKFLSENAAEADDAQISLLREQYYSMQAYYNILTKRLEA